MFSGIVEELGKVIYFQQQSGLATLEAQADKVLEGTQIGDSIAFNGTCLTVTQKKPQSIVVELAPETLKKTNLGSLQSEDIVNLERSIQVGARIGGHFVQGHVDEVGEVRSIRPEGQAKIIEFAASRQLMRYIVVKGYIAIDGMSLTIVERLSDSFTISFIPHTIDNTIVRKYQVGTKVNLEADILGKYVERFFIDAKSDAGIDQKMLSRYGFIEGENDAICND